MSLIANQGCLPRRSGKEEDQGLNRLLHLLAYHLLERQENTGQMKAWFQPLKL